ncbi:MAG: hypothetical protein QOF19_3213 [Alphaproteobacteria bacterium]|jgi:ElaB/YqjD/DUF883 family membrane-anchored ribosome-binding protein|nr:hypothetical protein [Alphaproteobacteria bacterium]MEA2977693.1 hypothetical protein [Alphaproteobacteria bacterium]MEA2991721.1 hypothetical protein [Alphaproteobacteria bacterium]
MTKKSSRSADDITAIEDLMEDLETRLRRLNTKAKDDASDGSGDIKEFVTEALASISARLRDSADSVTHSVTDEAARVGGDAIKKIWDEMEQRPLLTLAVAAGLGYLVGLIGRRD